MSRATLAKHALFRGAASVIAFAIACGGGSDGAPSAAEKPIATSVTFSTATAIVGLRAQVRLDLAVRDAQNHDIASLADIQWSSSDQSHATVDATGLITGVALGGPTTITATSNGHTAMIALSVTPARIEITPAVSVLVVTGSVQLTGSPVDFYGVPLQVGPVTWATSDPGIATIDQTGFVRAIAAGNAEITASAGGRTSLFGLLIGVPSIYDGSFVNIDGNTQAHVVVLFGRVTHFDASLHPTPQCPMSVSNDINVPISATGSWQATLGASPGGTAATSVVGTFGSGNSVTGSVFGTLPASCQYGQLVPVSATLGTFVSHRQ